jgi:hypothetical protein
MTGVHQVIASSGGAGLIALRSLCISNDGIDGTASTTLVLNVPTLILGFREPPQVGDLLLTVVSRSGTTGNVTWSAGWNEIEDGASTTGLAYAWKICDLADIGGSVTITSSNSVNMCAIMIGIMNHDSASAPVDGTAATGTSTTPDPPANAAHSWGTGVDTLFITVASHNLGSLLDGNPSHPSGYTFVGVRYNPQINTSITLAWKIAKATTDNPGTWAFANSGGWRTNTIAVRGLV